MAESERSKSIRAGLSKIGFRLFRNNVAQGWVGKVIKRAGRLLTLADYRPLHAGLTKGSADLIGWIPIIITPEMVGQQIALFASIEVKEPTGVATLDQLGWHAVVRKAGGFAVITTSEANTIEEFKKTGFKIAKD